MADNKAVTQLNAGTAIVGTERVLAVQSGVDVTLTAAQFLAYVQSSLLVAATLGATTATTLNVSGTASFGGQLVDISTDSSTVPFLTSTRDLTTGFRARTGELDFIVGGVRLAYWDAVSGFQITGKVQSTTLTVSGAVTFGSSITSTADFTVSAGNAFTLFLGANGTTVLATQGSYIGLLSSVLFGWAAAGPGAVDTNFNRASAGVLNLGTTAANALGTLNAASIVLSSNFYVGTTANVNFGTTRSVISSPTDANIRLADSNQTTFGLLQLGGTTSSFPAIKRNSASLTFRLADDSAYTDLSLNNLIAFGYVIAGSGSPIPAGGTAGLGLLVSSTANFGVFFGSGAPSLAAAKGSLYLRSDGSGTTDRAYINTNGSTTWTALTTVA